jgi:hypothetical protein
MAVELVRLTEAKLVLLRVFEEMRPIYDEQCRDVIWLDPSNPRMGLPMPEILEPVIVLTSHGPGGLTRFLLGSVAT